MIHRTAFIFAGWARFGPFLNEIEILEYFQRTAGDWWIRNNCPWPGKSGYFAGGDDLRAAWRRVDQSFMVPAGLQGARTVRQHVPQWGV